MSTPARIHVVRQGNFANQMIQYLAAKRIQATVPGAEITGVNLSSWMIYEKPLGPLAGRLAEYNWHELPVDEVSQKLRDGVLDGVILSGYFQRLQNLPTLDQSREIFPATATASRVFDEKHLVISIRANEILSGGWQNYTLVPCAYYREIIEQTGLKPVFTGQIKRAPYRSLLEREFPDASFYESAGMDDDFAIIRSCSNIVLSVSTFSWLAAWLSRASRIFMPLTGFYNPFQDRDVRLVPLQDERYIFYLFPINYAVPFEHLHLSHETIRGRWKQVTPAMLECLMSQWPRFGRKTAVDYEPFFDESFYQAEYGDVAAAVRSGHKLSGRVHFLENGFGEGRAAFRADWGWYGRTYPLAAQEVGYGDFYSFSDHFIAVGHARGYRPHPH